MKYDNSLKEKAIELYNSGLYAKEVERVIGVNEATIRKWAREEGIIRHRGPKSKIDNESYFDNIDSNRKAYWLGWLMADGNISINYGQHSLKLHIALKDKELIDNFLKDIKSSNKTKIKKGKNPSYYCSLTSVHMCNKLISYGIVPNKTGRKQISKIEDKFVSHFIRGFFDGDGVVSIGQDKKGYYTYRCGFVGQEEVLNFILKELKIERNLLKTNTEGCYYFLIGRRLGKILYNYIYKDADIWLKRKKDIMNIIVGNAEVSD